MADIYFSKNKKGVFSKVSKASIKAASFSLARFTPYISNKLAEKLLCTPLATKSFKSLDQRFKEEKIEVLNKEISIYLAGNEQRFVLFSHGWSGNATNFSSFYDFYLERGFGVITIDHIAHGKSEGDISNYFYFFKTVRAVHQKYEKKIIGVLGHSLGAAAILGARLPESLKLCLLAPPLSVFEFLFDKAKEAGISALMIEKFLQSYEKRYDVSREQIDPKRFISELKNEICIFHCEDDEYVSVNENVKHLNYEQQAGVSRLNSVGHFRILKSKDVIEQSLEFFDE